MAVALVLLQVVAVVTTMVAWIPQAKAGLKSRSTEGVSRAAWLIAAALGATWSVYGVLNSVWLLALSEGTFAIGSVAVLCTLVPARRAAAGVVLALTIGALAVFLLPATAFSFAGVAASVAVRGSQLARMVTRRDATGVADASWWLLTVALLCWGVFGIIEGKPALAVGLLLGVVSSIAVVSVSVRLRAESPQ